MEETNPVGIVTNISALTPKTHTNSFTIDSIRCFEFYRRFPDDFTQA
jgi:hypothetical protein